MEFNSDLIHTCEMLRFYFLVFCYLLVSNISAQEFQINYRVVCELPAEISESSGLIMDADGNFWTHGDDKNPSELYQFDTLGNLLRTLSFKNIQNVDWEDITIDYDGNFWIGDVGNNDSDREDLAIYKVSNPNLHDSDEVWASVLSINYPDQSVIPSPIGNRNFDVEGIAFFRDSILLITKNRAYPNSGYVKVYAVPAIPGKLEARLLDSFYTETNIQLGKITGADFLPKENVLVMNSLRRIYTIPLIQQRFEFDSLKVYRMDYHTNQFESIIYQGNGVGYMTAEKPSVFCEFTLSDTMFDFPAKLHSMDQRDMPFVYDGFLRFKSDFTGEIQMIDGLGRIIKAETIHQIREYKIPQNALVVVFESDQGKSGMLKLPFKD